MNFSNLIDWIFSAANWVHGLFEGELAGSLLIGLIGGVLSFSMEKERKITIKKGLEIVFLAMAVSTLVVSAICEHYGIVNKGEWAAKFLGALISSPVAHGFYSLALKFKNDPFAFFALVSKIWFNKNNGNNK